MNTHARPGFLTASVLVFVGLLLGESPAIATQLTLELRDGTGLLPVAARVQVQDASGWLWSAPDSTLWTRSSVDYGPYRHIDDNATVTVQTGQVTVRAVRGMSGIPVEITATVNADTTWTLPLDLWVDAPAEGWWAGDAHVHTYHPSSGSSVYPEPPLDHTALVGRAESVDLLALLQNDPLFPGGHVTPAQPGVALLWGEEYRSAYWGHVVLLGLSSLVLTDGSPGCCNYEGSAWPTLESTLGSAPPPLAYFAHPHTTDTPQYALVWPEVGHARERGPVALASWMHGMAVASGTNAPNSKWAFEGYLDAIRAGARWTAMGEGDRSLDRYATSPPGEIRTYAKVDAIHPAGSTAGADQWFQSVQSARTFATTGPFVHEFTVNAAGVGETVMVTAPTNVTADITVSSWAPLDQAILHGATGEHWSMTWPATTTLIDETIVIPIVHDDFLLLEVSGPTGSWWVAASGPRAVTSPIWIDAALPWVMPAAAARRTVDELDLYLSRLGLERPFTAPADSIAVNDYLVGARDTYEALVDDPPLPTSLVAPTDGFQLAPTTAMMTWDPVSSYDGEPVTYRVILADNPLMTNPMWSPATSTPAHNWTNLTRGQTYWWDVATYEDLEGPVWSTNGPWSFAVIENPVAAPVTSQLQVGPVRWRGGLATFALEMPQSGAVSLEWYDVRGRSVRRHQWPHLDAGSHRLTWDGNDERGRRVASAVYLGVLKVGPARRVLKTLVPRP